VLDSRARELAINDPHSKRKPRPCGITVHTGIGCPNACVYCYIQDMGFTFRKAVPYRLKGKEFVYALINNPYFIPGVGGTYLAFGSITDPFNKDIKSKTLEYMLAISKYLRNPMQFSTKEYISQEEAEMLRNISTNVSPLITIVTLRKWKRLEPNALRPELRLESIRNLRKAGFYPFLFLRPLIPGINEDEIDDILQEAKEYGAIGVVVGGFRVTKNILYRLRKAGFNVKDILERVNTRRLSNRKQINLSLRDIKVRTLMIAKERGLRGVLSACCAMTYVINRQGYTLPCANICFTGRMCTSPIYCNNQCGKKLPDINEEDVKTALREELNVNILRLEIIDKEIIAYVDRKISYNSNTLAKLRMLSTLYRRRIVIQ